MEKGYIQIYTGGGKGKTTAAIGVAIRSIAAGMRVFFGQFMKKGYSSEQGVFSAYPNNITLRQYGSGKFIMGEPSAEDIRLAQNGWAECKAAITGGEYDVIIMDEMNTAVNMGLVELGELLEQLAGKPGNVEIIITGRNAPQKLIDAADLVTEMREIKHYYTQGVQARVGIEE